ncbi:MAG TPA: cytochrome c, partial [Rubrivivax sp.]|nr:cytochrome c [Rubrivivax sp.]
MASGSFVRWFGVWVALLLGMAANVAQGADTYGDVCTGCHQASANGPPLMPSQDATFGKIMAETGQFEDSCTATFNCVLRQRLKGENSSGT